MSKSTLGVSDLIAFAPTTQPEKALHFYQQTLGLRLVADTPYALVFDAHGTMLRVAKVPELTPAPFTILGWKVPDIRATVKKLTAGGVVFNRYDGLSQDDLGIWASPNGDFVCWFKDPDGNTLSLTQFVSRPKPRSSSKRRPARRRSR